MKSLLNRTSGKGQVPLLKSTNSITKFNTKQTEGRMTGPLTSSTMKKTPRVHSVNILKQLHAAPIKTTKEFDSVPRQLPQLQSVSGKRRQSMRISSQVSIIGSKDNQRIHSRRNSLRRTSSSYKRLTEDEMKKVLSSGRRLSLVSSTTSIDQKNKTMCCTCVFDKSTLPTYNLGLLAFLVSLYGYLLRGFPMGLINVTDKVVFSVINSSFVKHYNITPDKQQIAVMFGTTNNCWYLGGAIGCVLAGWLMDRFGRRISLYFVPPVISWVASGCYLASFFTVAFEVLIVARMIDGIVSGLAITIVPIYLTEFSPPRCRALVVGWNGFVTQIWMFLGMVLAMKNAMGTLEKWGYLYAMPALFATPLFFLGFFLPESPSYLYVEKHRKEEAKSLVAYYFGSEEDIAEYMQEIEADSGVSREKMTLCQAWKKKPLRGNMVLTAVVAITLSIAGHIEIGHFSTRVFIDVGIEKPTPQYLTLIPVALRIAGGFVTPCLLDLLGRRKLLLTSLAGQIFFLSLTTLFGTIREHLDTGTWPDKLNLLFSCATAISFATGVAPVCILLGPEIMPTSARASVITASQAVGHLLACVLGSVLPLGIKTIGTLTMLPLVIVPSVACLIYLYFKLPETSNMSTMQLYVDVQDWNTLFEDDLSLDTEGTSPRGSIRDSVSLNIPDNIKQLKTPSILKRR